MEKYSVLSSLYIKDKPEYVARGLQSISEQTIAPDEVVIISDGEVTEELKEVVKRFKKILNIVEYSLPENKGLGAALAVGTEKCSNEFVFRLDLDDIALPLRAEKQLACFERDQNLDVVGSYMYEFSNDENSIDTVKVMPVTNSDIYYVGRRRNPFNHSSVMFRRSSVLKYGNYNKNYRRGQDIELFTRMIRNGANCYNIPEPLIKYRLTQDQFERRTNKLSSDTIIKVVYNNYKEGYSKLPDVIYTYIIEKGARIIPKKIGRIMYKHMRREKPNLNK